MNVLEQNNVYDKSPVPFLCRFVFIVGHLLVMLRKEPQFVWNEAA